MLGSYHRKKLREELSFREYVVFLFWERVERGKRNECWEWCGTHNKQGYGVLKIQKFPGQRGRHWAIPAHRLSYRMTKGKFYRGLCICHACDNPGCVNPGHLFLGTQQENMQDMVEKDRQAKGEICGSSKLTSALVREIRELALTREYTQKELAERFGLSSGGINHVVKGKVWSDLPGAFHGRYKKKGLRENGAKLTEDDVREIRKRWGSGGYTQGQLAELFGVEQTTISTIVLRKTWKDVE